MFKLVIQDDEGKTTVVPLIRDEITIGRKEGNTIRLTERNVSRRHARIVRNNGAVLLEDLDSYNGILETNGNTADEPYFVRVRYPDTPREAGALRHAHPVRGRLATDGEAKGTITPASCRGASPPRRGTRGARYTAEKRGGGDGE